MHGVRVDGLCFSLGNRRVGGAVEIQAEEKTAHANLAELQRQDRNEGQDRAVVASIAAMATVSL